MRSALVTGASRGIGLALTRSLANASPHWRVFAAARRPEDSKELQTLGAVNENVHILKLDVTDLNAFEDFAKNLSQLTEDSGLNLLINNAGITTKFTTLNYVKSQDLVDNFMTNTIGPIMLTKSLLPSLKLAADKNSSLPMSINRAAIINMSSVLGSITLNDKGGFYPYRCSKTALNAATRSMSIDIKRDNILVVSIHPGWVKTDMGGKNAPLDLETSVTGIIKTIEQLGEKDSGQFFQYDGSQLEW